MSMEDRNITLISSMFTQLSEMTTVVLNGEIKVEKEKAELKMQQIQFEKEKAEFEKKKDEWNKQKAEEAFKILINLPPSMHNRSKNESFPIVRFCYKTHHSWYQTFITRYHDLCILLRNMYNTNDCTEGVQIQIAAIFHYKNFPAHSFLQLHLKVNKLVKMLEGIKGEIPNAQLLEHIDWFKNLNYPLDEARKPITVNMNQECEAIRTAWGPEEYVSDEEEQQAEED